MHEEANEEEFQIYVQPHSSLSLFVIKIVGLHNLLLLYLITVLLSTNVYICIRMQTSKKGIHLSVPDRWLLSTSDATSVSTSTACQICMVYALPLWTSYIFDFFPMLWLPLLYESLALPHSHSMPRFPEDPIPEAFHHSLMIIIMYVCFHFSFFSWFDGSGFSRNSACAPHESDGYVWANVN